MSTGKHAAETSSTESTIQSDLFDLMSIRAGEAAARDDIQKIIAFDADHTAHHATDPEWDCHPSSAEFWTFLGADHADVLADDLIARAAYTRMIQAHHHQRQSDGSASTFSLTVIPVETDGTETEEELERKVFEAIAADDEFDAIVGDTKPSTSKIAGLIVPPEPEGPEA